MDIELSTVRFKIHVLYHIATEKKKSICPAVPQNSDWQDHEWCWIDFVMYDELTWQREPSLAMGSVPLLALSLAVVTPAFMAQGLQAEGADAL